MFMMIKMKEIILVVTPGTQIYVDIDIFRFIKDTDLSLVVIEIEDEFIDEVDAPLVMNTHAELKDFALNWISNNVKITNELM